MPDDALTQYLDEISQHPLLGRADELRLGRLAASGDETAKRRLVESNLLLVVAIARRYRGLGIDLLDLVQEGNVGLVAAAERYDWRRGVKFGTYASWWIRREICLALSTKSRLVRLPRRVAESATKVKRAERAVTQRLGRRGTLAEVAGEAGVDEETVATLRRAELAPVSLSEPIADDLLGFEEQRRDDSDVRAAVATLAERPRRILELRYGLDGGQPRSLAEVAGELGVSRERVRQTENRTLHQLGARLAA